MRFTDFARRILRLRLTLGQSVCSKVAFDGLNPCDLKGAERAIADVMFGGVEVIPESARRNLVLRCGRGSGKSLLAAAHGVYRLFTADIRSCGPGDEPAVIVISPRLKTSRIALRAACALVVGSPELKPYITSQTTEAFRIRRPDAGRDVTFVSVPKSSGGSAARGLSLMEVLVDESEFLPAADPAAAVSDADILRSVRPRLIRGGLTILMSTPWPAESATSSMYNANFGIPKDALCAMAPSLVMRDNDPEIAARRAAEMESDPNNALREYDCICTDSESGMFSSSNIDASVSCTIVPARTKVSAGIDLAFRSDASALVILERQMDKLVVVHVQMLSPKPGKPLVPSEVMGTFGFTARGFGAKEIVADNHYIESAREHAGKAGISVVSGPQGAGAKESSFLYVRDLLREGKLVLPADPKLIGQLKSVLAVPQPGGGLRVILPRRNGAGHADMVSALVVAAAYDRRHGPLIGNPVVEMPQAIASGYSWK